MFVDDILKIVFDFIRMIKDMIPENIAIWVILLIAFVGAYYFVDWKWFFQSRMKMAFWVGLLLFLVLYLS